MDCSTCNKPAPQHSNRLPKQVIAPKCEDKPTIFHKVVRPASLGGEDVAAPETLQYKNVLLVYEATDHAYIYSSDGAPTGPISTDISKLEKAVAELGGRLDETETRLEAEIKEREETDNSLQQQIDDIINSPDVRYIVDTYAELNQIDKSTIGDQDYARVLQDETHENASTYYQFDKGSNKWRYVGMTGPYYTKTEIDGKLDSIDHDIENLTELMPAVVQETGDSEHDVMSQKAVTEALANAGGKVEVANEYGDSTETAISQGFVSSKLNGQEIAIGEDALAEYPSSIAIGKGANIPMGDKGKNSIAIGVGATTTYDNAIAIGNKAQASRSGEFSVGNQDLTSNYEKWRFVANVRAGVLDTDAVNKKQMEDYVAEHGGGGGSSVSLLTEYTAEPGENATYDASYLNDIGYRANEYTIKLATPASSKQYTGVGIGGGANSIAQTSKQLFSFAAGPGSSARVGRTLDENESSIAIGRNAQGDGNTVAIGDQATAIAERNTVAIGTNAVTSHYVSVALGYNSITSRQSEVSIGNGGSNSYTTTRYLANVRAGVLDTDATNVAQVRDMISEAGGGGSATLYNAYGSNTDGALTQKFVSDKLNGTYIVLGQNSVANAPGTVAIGNGARISGSLLNSAIAIGATAIVEKAGSIAIGENAISSYPGSVAIGQNSRNSRNYEFSIGATGGAAIQRRLANVAEGELDTDAVNVKQLNDAVGNINTLLETLISGEGAKA